MTFNSNCSSADKFYTCTFYFLTGKYYRQFHEMINLIQWRATIVTWYCSSVKGSHKRKRSKRRVDNGEVSHSVDEWWIGSLQVILTEAVILSYSLVMKLMILLLLCGVVEINPGPINIGEFYL